MAMFTVSCRKEIGHRFNRFVFEYERLCKPQCGLLSCSTSALIDRKKYTAFMSRESRKSSVVESSFKKVSAHILWVTSLSYTQSVSLITRSRRSRTSANVLRFVYTNANNIIFEGKGKCLEIVIVAHYKINIFVHTSYFYEYIIYDDSKHNKISDDKTFLSTVINSTSAIFTGEQASSNEQEWENETYYIVFVIMSFLMKVYINLVTSS